MASFYTESANCANGCGALNFDWIAHIPEPSLAPPKELFVEVSFGTGVKKDFFRSEQLNWEIGDMVVVASRYGFDIGQICTKGFLAILQMKKKRYSISENTLQILRKANAEDLRLYTVAKHKEKTLLIEGRKIAESLGLEMKIAQVYIQRDGRRATFYYTAEERVDFRELLRQYATHFNLQIEMRHIGVRQAAKQVGGIGTCGRVLCCTSWLHNPLSITTSTARYQGLHLNKSKMNGQCGRLKCCLGFELESYSKLFKDMPETPDTIETDRGTATLFRKDIFRCLVTYKLENGALVVLDKPKIQAVIAQNKAGKSFIVPNENEDLPEGVVKSEQFSSVGELSLRNLTHKRKERKNIKARKNIKKS